MSTVNELIRHYQRSIEKCSHDEKRLLHCIDKLYRLPVTVQHLQETGVGRTVNALRKHDGNVGEAAKKLVSKWKEMVAAEETSEEERDDGNESGNNSEHEEHPEAEEKEESAEEEENEEEEHYRKDDDRCDRREAKDVNVANSHHAYSESRNSRDSGSEVDRKKMPVKTEERNHRVKSSRSASESPDRSQVKSKKYRRGSDDSDSDEKVYANGGESSRESHSRSKHRSNSSHHRRKRSSSGSDSSADDDEGSDKDEDSDDEVNNSAESEEEEDNSEETDSGDDSDDHKNRKHKSNHHKDDKRHHSHSKSSDKNKHQSKQNKHERSSKEKHKEKERHKEKHSADKYGSDKHNTDRHSTDKHRNKQTETTNRIHEKHKSSKEETKSKHSSDSSKEKDHKKHKHKDPEKEKHKKEEENVKKLDNKHSKNHQKSETKDKERKQKEEYKKERTEERHSKHSDNRTKTSESKSSKSSKEKSEKHTEVKSSKAEKHGASSSEDTVRSSGKSASVKKSHSDGVNGKSKKKESKSKLVVDNDGIDCSSGPSFAEALGMVDPFIPKQAKKRPTSTQPASTSSPKKVKKEVTSLSSIDFSSKGSSSPQLLLHPSLKPKLEPLDMDLTSTLPEINPNYRPLPHYNLPDSPVRKNKSLSEEDALSQVMSSKNQRTKVFSGVKCFRDKQVPSLYDLCIRILQENIDALEYTGGVPYDLLKPILDRATADQLYSLEHYNPYLIEDTDDLWKFHCKKEFHKEDRLELETWRDMYMRCVDEREARLKVVTENIRKLSEANSLPVRKTKLAYIEGAVKPPRNVARQQAKHGTAQPTAIPKKMETSVKNAIIANLNNNAAPVSLGRPGSSGSSVKQKPRVAPLMQKALKLIKSRYRR